MAEPLLLLRYKGNWGGEGHRYVQTFTVSDPSEATCVSDLKKLQNRASRRERGEQHYILSRGVRLTKTPQQRDKTFFWDLWIRTVTLPGILVNLHLSSEKEPVREVSAVTQRAQN